MNEMTVSEWLRRALEILRSLDWTQGDYVRMNKRGIDGIKAVCLLGAVGLAACKDHIASIRYSDYVGAYTYIDKKGEVYEDLFSLIGEYSQDADVQKILAEVIGEQYGEIYGNVTSIHIWNDEEATSKEEVEAVLEKAIVRAEEAGL